MKIEDEVGVGDPIRHILLHDLKNSYQTLAITMDMVVDLTLPNTTTFFSWKFHSISFSCSKTEFDIEYYTHHIYNFKENIYYFMNSTPRHMDFAFIPLTQQPSKYKIIECTFSHTSSCPITISTSSPLLHLIIICLVYKNEMTLDTFPLTLNSQMHAWVLCEVTSRAINVCMQSNPIHLTPHFICLSFSMVFFF